jgi:hypothetical protein
LFEKVLFFDVVVRVSLDQPLAERQELDWGVVLVKCQSFTTEGVVLLRVPILVLANLEIVRIGVWVRVKIYEHCFLFTL